MDKLNFNKILNRENHVNTITHFLENFEKNKNSLSQKRGIYVYGNPGCGKTYFIEEILKKLNYDIIKYDAGDVRNKNIIDMITKQNMSDTNVLSLLQKKVKKIAIIMDEIDGMNNGDKGGINSLIKLIRPKKTKKQKLEDFTLTPIICIGNYHIDKKIKELIKVCEVIELSLPKKHEIGIILDSFMSNLDDNIKEQLNNYIEGDLRKLKQIINLYLKNPKLINRDTLDNIFKLKGYNEDTKNIIKKLMNNNYSLNKHATIMNETDRTIVGLLWHENIIDLLSKYKKEDAYPFYAKILENYCFADYIDRITFQKQIWQFNEISSLIKTFHNNTMYHNYFKKKTKYNPSEVRFTKVLTKYSTEYNNSLFIQNLCQELNMDKKDMYGFFLDLKNKYSLEEIYNKLQYTEISKLDIDRLYRFMDSYSSGITLIDNESINE
tara:strand:+ start:2293 stop:3600 length:1308 start_codon:yes stop_codon:yes gene_type:complete